MTRTRLYLVRHGEQDPAANHGPDGGLSPLGRDQADRLGRRLRGVPFAAIHHSPSARAAETAAIVGGHLPGVPAHACDHVADRTPVPSDLGRYRSAGTRGSARCPPTSATRTRRRYGRPWSTSG